MFERLAASGVERLAVVALSKEEKPETPPPSALPVIREPPKRLNLGRLLGNRKRMGEDCCARRGCVCHAPPPYAVAVLPQPPGTGCSLPLGCSINSSEATTDAPSTSLPSRSPPRTASATTGSRPHTSRRRPAEVARELRKKVGKAKWTQLQAKLTGTDLNTCASQTSLASTAGSGRLLGRGRRYRKLAHGAVRSFLTQQQQQQMLQQQRQEKQEAGDDTLPDIGDLQSERGSVLASPTSPRSVEGSAFGSSNRDRRSLYRNSSVESVRTVNSLGRLSNEAFTSGHGRLPSEAAMSEAATEGGGSGAADPASAYTSQDGPDAGGGVRLGEADVVRTLSEKSLRRDSLEDARIRMASAQPSKPSKSAVLKSTKRERLSRLQARAHGLAENENRRKRFNALPQDELDAIMQAFDRFDDDASGYLDQSEVVACLRELGLRGTNTAEKREILRICNECTAPKRKRKQQLSMLPGERNDEYCYVDVITFALNVVPQVRDRLGQMQGNEMMRQFFHFDKDGTGRLPPSQCVQIARCCGLDQLLMWRELDEIPGGPPDTLDYDEFQEVYYRASDRAQRKMREREKQIKEGTGISDMAFQEFRSDIASLYDIFTKYDVDESGMLDRDEVMAAMGEFGVMPRNHDERRAVERVISYCDTDGNNEFDFEEFLGLVRTVRKYRQDKKSAEQRACFERYDKDQSGTLTVAEISSLLCDIGCVPHTKKEQEELAQLIYLTDADGSGYIEFEEFQVLSQRIEEKLQSMRYEEEVEYAMKIGFHEQNLRDFRLLFDTLDTDGSGKLDASEVRHGLVMMDKRAHRVSDEAFESAFRTLDADNSGSLDFREFVDLMRLIRDGEGLFSEDLHKLSTQAKFLDTRVLRHVLEIFRLSKAYIISMPKEELVATFCDCFKVGPSENIHERLHIKTVAELYEVAQKREAAQQLRRDLAKERSARAAERAALMNATRTDSAKDERVGRRPSIGAGGDR